MGVFSVEVWMVIWTWVTFLLLAVILYKFAFKRILEGLAAREERITKSVETAERIERELQELEAKRASVVAEAHVQAKDIVAAARKAAQETAHAIEVKAREEAQISVENAVREIRIAQEKARASLRQESAELAASLAARLISQNLDVAANRALTDKLITQLQHG